MVTVAVELNDVGIVVATAHGVVSAASPGYALVDGESLVTGVDARAQARLHPRRIDNRFWLSPDAKGLPSPFPVDLSRADLAHAHLSAVLSALKIDAGTHVAIAISGAHTVTDLARIAGIAEAAGLTVRAMVDAAVAAAASITSAGGPILHLDLQLHRAILTGIAQDGGLVRRWVDVLDDGGVVSIEDRIAKRIGDLFVRTTRFDPLYTATTEQSLYDAMPRWLYDLQSSDRTTAVLTGGGRRHATDLPQAEIIAAIDDIVEQLTTLVRRRFEPGSQLICSDRAAAVPGLVDHLTTQFETVPVRLPLGAAAVGAANAIPQLVRAGAELQFVSRLATATKKPAPTKPASPPPRPREQKPAPTHILWGSTAYAITTTPLVIGTDAADGKPSLCLVGATAGISRRHCQVISHGDQVVVEDFAGSRSWLNAHRIDGRCIAVVGDRLRLGDQGLELLFINVRDH